MVLGFIIIGFMGLFPYLNLECWILYFFWMFLHEFIHGIGFYISGVKHKNIVYGANLEKGIFYCMCKEKISKKGIMISLLFPFTFIGVITLVVGLIINCPILIILSLLNIAGCAGDIAMTLAFIKLPQFSYLDLDDCTGFVLVSDNDLSKYKLFGLDLVESGSFSKLGKASDYKKFTVSKLSWVVFGLLVLVLLISIFCK
jgi:hypothetical protein